MKNDLETRFQQAKNDYKRYLMENPRDRGRISGAIYIDQDLLVLAIQANSMGYKCKGGEGVPMRDYFFDCGSSPKESLQALEDLCYYLKADEFYEDKKCWVGIPYWIEMDCLIELFEDMVRDVLNQDMPKTDYFLDGELFSSKDGIQLKIKPITQSPEEV